MFMLNITLILQPAKIPLDDIVIKTDNSDTVINLGMCQQIKIFNMRQMLIL